MYTKIKKLADDAVALQNKIEMEKALIAIGELCKFPEANYGKSIELKRSDVVQNEMTKEAKKLVEKIETKKNGGKNAK